MFGRRLCVNETGRKIGHRVDAAGDGRAPDRRWFFERAAGARRFFAAPSRSKIGRRICVNETGRKIGRRVDAAGDGRAPGAIAFSNALRERGRRRP